MDDDIAIKVENVSKTFKLPHEKSNSLKSAVVNFWRHDKGYELQKALNDISFEVKKGEFFGIVGRNGSGKSTLLKLLAGIYSPSKGTIAINGKLTPFIELGVGFSPDLTGRENVFLNGALLGFNRKEMDAMYDDIVDFAELERFMDQKLKNYSSGMQVRLAFAIAVQAKSDILLLDEVLAVGDAAFQQKCYDYFEQLKQNKQTIVFVTHDMDAVQRFCDRGIVLERGVVKSIGDPIEVADIYKKDNIENVGASSGGVHALKNSSIALKVLSKSPANNKILFQIGYKTVVKEDVYVGFSVIRNGVSVAELNSMNNIGAQREDKLIYELDPEGFNPGMYELSATLFVKKNRQPIAVTEKRQKIVIGGYDKTRGGALKLKESWIKH